MNFRELNSWTLGTRGVESPTLISCGNDTNWECITKQYVNFTPDITLINGFSYSFWIAKTHELLGQSPRNPARGMESLVDSAWHENLLSNYIKSKLIILQFNIITNMLQDISLKKHESEDMIKTKARKTWEWSCEFYPAKQVFLDF